MTRFLGKNRHVEMVNRIIKSEFLVYKSLEQRRPTYERVLDEYLYTYERIKNMGMSVDVGVQAQQDFLLVKARIPFVLTALEHDDLAVSELCMTMDFSERSPRIPKSKLDDILQELLDERKSSFASWPALFLLPLLVIKLRLVCDWKTCSCFFQTTYFPDDVKKNVGEFLIGQDIKTDILKRYADQKRQVRVIVNLLKQQEPDNLETILSQQLHDEDEYEEDLIAYLFENDSGFLDRGLFDLFRQCFQEPASLKS